MNSPILQSLKDVFGFDSFRQGQEQTITQLLSGDSSLSLFPTGSGKSLCYQLTALHLPQLTLVVSPLLALMKDQLEFLASKGIKAASIDSTLKGAEAQAVMKGVRDGDIKILMVSVERFKNERFRQFIHGVQISLLVVDEAHCISEWGHNFRPDYLKLPRYAQALNIPLVLLLTATATKQVKQDMAEKFAIDPNHIVQTGFYRNNLELSVIAIKQAQKNEQLIKLINQQNGAGIVYVTLHHTAEHVAQFLMQRGINAQAYHAGFSSENRQQIQSDFMMGNTQVIVATIAFGMGIDKSDIRFVIHYDLAKSIESYSQEIGRAGRDGQLSHCITLANLDGLTTVENFVYGDTPEQSGIEYVIHKIIQEVNCGRWELQLLALSSESNIKQLPLKTLLVQLELCGVIEPQYAYFADFKIKLLQPINQIMTGFNPQRQAFLRAIFGAVEFKKVWGSLNFNTLLQDETIDRNRVVAALEYLQAQQLIILETKSMTEVFTVNTSPLYNPLLAKNLTHYFLDKEQKEIARIAKLIKFFQLDTCLTASLARYFDDKTFDTPARRQCGHCSACKGRVAKLEYSNNHLPWPSDEVLNAAMDDLDNKLASKIKPPLSVENYCRFFAGMTTPIFGRNKIRQLSGFAICDQQRYQDIRDKISQLRRQRMSQ